MKGRFKIEERNIVSVMYLSIDLFGIYRDFLVDSLGQNWVKIILVKCHHPRWPREIPTMKTKALSGYADLNICPFIVQPFGQIFIVPISRNLISGSYQMWYPYVLKLKHLINMCWIVFLSVDTPGFSFWTILYIVN